MNYFQISLLIVRLVYPKQMYQTDMKTCLSSPPISLPFLFLSIFLPVSCLCLPTCLPPSPYFFPFSVLSPSHQPSYLLFSFPSFRRINGLFPCWFMLHVFDRAMEESVNRALHGRKIKNKNLRYQAFFMRRIRTEKKHKLDLLSLLPKESLLAKASPLTLFSTFRVYCISLFCYMSGL